MTSQTSKIYTFMGLQWMVRKLSCTEWAALLQRAQSLRFKNTPVTHRNCGQRVPGSYVWPSASKCKTFLSLSQRFSPVFLLLTSLDFSFPDSLGLFELHIGFGKTPCSASILRKRASKVTALWLKRAAARCADSSTTSAPANPCLGHIFQIMMALKASFWLCVAPFRHRCSRAFFIRLM